MIAGYKADVVIVDDPIGTELVITLKEITDLIGKRHDKSLIKVEELALEPSFGAVSKIDIVYNEQGQTIQTMVFNKKQAIAVGAKLNNKLLMTVIDRLEELEKANNKPKELSKKEVLLISLELEEKNEQLLLENKELESYKK